MSGSEAPITQPAGPAGQRPRQLGLRWRIGLGFAALAAVLFGAVGWFSGQQARAQSQDEAFQVLAQLAARVVSDLDIGMYERWREIRNLAATVEEGGIDPDRWRTRLQRLQASNPHYSWVGIADLGGRVLAATGGLLEGQDVSSRPWFRGARERTFVGDVHDALMLARLLPPDASGEPLRLVDFAAPVQADGQVAAVLGAHLDWRWADERRRQALTGAPLGDGIEILVVGAQGQVLLGPPQPAPAPAVALAAAGAAPVAWGDGRRYLTAAVRSQGHGGYAGMGWTVLVRQPEAIALQRAVTLERRIWAAGAAGALLFGLLGWGLAGGLTAPLRAAAQQARGLLADGPDEAGAADPRAMPVGDEVALLSSSLQRLQRRAALLNDSNAELQNFSRSVSHDLRGPIGSIGQLLRQVLDNPDEPLGERAQRSLAVVVQECERLLQLVDELLTLAMVDQRDMQRAPVDMRAMVDEVVALTAPSGAAPRFVIGELPPVDGDALLLRQVWQNLIGNAVKFSGRVARPRIEIDATVAAGETVYRVRDNGAGFDMGHAARLFKVFQRLHSTADFGGTGVGLSIVDRVVKRHGGRVWAESTVGAGACFCFSLPAPAGAGPRGT